jgi:hypothetical protein
MGARQECREREYVPSIYRHDVGNQHVDLLGRVMGVAPRFTVPDGYGVSPAAGSLCRLHLHTPETRAGIYHKVVSVAVAVWFRDAESQAGSFE